MSNSSACIVIPARLKSTRLPEKPLADIHGRPMIQHVYERAKKVAGVNEVFVATDSEKIAKVVEKFGGKVLMTPEDLASGSDRVAYVAKSRKEEIFVNVQGDEPLVDPEAISATLELVRSGRFEMTTPAAAFPYEEAPIRLADPNTVKVLVAKDQTAIYFSRFAIPFSRMSYEEIDKTSLDGKTSVRQHIGIYAYRRETLLKLTSLPRCSWEVGESLEQLRALYNGIRIGVAEAKDALPAVDTLADLERVRKLMLE